MLLITIILGVYGLIVGSFLNALVWRVHEGKSIAKGRSMCPKCQHELAAKDLVPLFSWLWLRGKCRYCQQSISLQYPLVELATAVLFAVSYWQLQPIGLHGWLSFLIWLYVLASLIFLTVYDLRWYLLPNKVLLPAIAVVAIWLVVQLAAFGLPLTAFGRPFLAAILAGGIFLVLAMVANGKLMGMGDVKLVVLMGLWLGLRKTGVALMLALYTAAIVGLVLLALRRKGRKDYLPFGPFLAAGAVTAYLWGGSLIDWYLHLTGF